MSIEFEQVLMTPECAAALLSQNTANRRIRQFRVQQYAADIKAGRWVPSPEPIIIAADGTLINGQHRLSAIVLAATAAPLTISRGWDASLYPVIDTGARRTSGDYLDSIGIERATTVAALASWQFRWERYKIHASTTMSGCGHQQVAEVLERYPDLRVVARESSAHRRLPAIGRLQPAAWAWFRWQIQRREENRAVVFIDQVERGLSLVETDPAYGLRVRLEGDVKATAKLPFWHLLAFCVKSWNRAFLNEPAAPMRMTLKDVFPDILPRLPGDPSYQRWRKENAA